MSNAKITKHKNNKANEQLLDNLSYEQAVQRLEQINHLLTSPQTSLDDLQKLYVEGMELIAYCETKLNNIEQQIEIYNQ